MNLFARTYDPLVYTALAMAIPLSGLCASSEAGNSTNEGRSSSISRSEGRDSTVENSVVKVFGTVRYPDLYKPWTKLSPADITGSGVVIEGKRILTSAHVVAYASQVQIQANQAGDKIAATV